MYKTSTLTELYGEAIKTGEKFGLSMENYHFCCKAKADLETELFKCMDGYAKERFLKYLDICDQARKYQITDAIRKGYRTGILEADSVLRDNRQAFISTSELLHLFAMLKKDDRLTVQDVFFAVEEFIGVINCQPTN